MKYYKNGENWKTSLQLADEVNKKHNHTIRDIKTTIDKILLKKQQTNFEYKQSFYQSGTGKKYTMYLLNESFYNFMLNKYKFNSQIRYGEDLLKAILEGTFLDNVKCQYKILNYRVDFYIPYLSLIIEYDEDFHEKQKKEDKKRMKEILEELKKQLIEKEEWNSSLIKKPASAITHVLRIKQGEEFSVINKALQYIDDAIGIDILTKEDNFYE